MRKKMGCIMLLVVAGTAILQATEPEHVVLDSYADFIQGISRSVTLSDDGFIERAPNLENLAEIKADQIWSVISDNEGGYLAATSPEGRLFQVTKSGQVREACKFAETHLYALVKNGRGEIFIGTSPDGKIYKWNGQDKVKPTVYFDPKQKYIWALAFDKKGNLYAATGTEGKIFKITGEGKGEVFYDADETHIRALAFDATGNLWAGSADSGLLYRINPAGEAVALAGTGKQEVNRIAVGPDNSIYFTATGQAKNSAPKITTVVATLAAQLGLPSLNSSNNESEDGLKNSGAVKSGGFPAKANEASSLSQLWKLDASLYPQVLWNTRETILTLDVTEKGALVGTANEGYWYRIDDRGHATRLLKVEGPSLSATLMGEAGWQILAASNPARLFMVNGPRKETGEAGIYESKVIDSGSFARWGALRTQGDGRCELRTRSGNTPKPDKTWHPWEKVSDEHAQSPAARYMQFELRLTEGKVDRVELVYLPRNVPPKVEQVEVLAPGLGYVALPQVVPPPQPKNADQLLNQNNASAGGSIFQPQVRFQPTESRGLRTVTWKATDANGDDLTYTVSYRREGVPTWRILAEDLDVPVFSWDASGWPDGNYYIKIEATDKPSNAPEEARTDELVSKMFIVDNTAPVIRIQSSRGGLVQFTVREEASGLSDVAISRDGKKFTSLRPVDGILDSPLERFEVAIKKDEVLFIRAEDQAGNVSSAQAQP